MSPKFKFSYELCGFIAFCIIFIVVANVGEFLLETAKTAGQWLIEKAEDLAEWLSYVVITIINSLVSLIAAMLLAFFRPFIIFFSWLFNGIFEFFKLLELYWKTDQQEFKSFWAFRRYMRGEEDPKPNDQQNQKQNQQQQNNQQAPPKKDKPKNTYHEALTLLGFPVDSSFTKTDLKKRYRELISRVHPDKGCPTSTLAQQINDAVTTIKQRRNWT